MQLDIAKIKRLDKDRYTVHEKVYTTYSVYDVGKNHYVQIDTYGRSDREQPGTVSQSIQLDKEAAKYLVELLKKEYDLDSVGIVVKQRNLEMTMQKFLDEFEIFCQTPGIESGAARSYANAIAYLCDYLKILVIDNEAVARIRSVENAVNDKNSAMHKDLLEFLSIRGRKSYLSKGWIRAGLNHFFDFVTIR